MTKMLALAVDGKLTESEMQRIIAEEVFEESVLFIPPAIQNQQWQLIDENFNTDFVEAPSMPLTILEKRWLKTILQDPRIALFMEPTEELKDVEPLFSPDDVVYFDRYLDGDKYDHPGYVANFHKVMQAIYEHRKIKIKYRNTNNLVKWGTFYPVKMEYSDKEDKFRLLAAGKWNLRTVNMGRIIKCELLDATFESELELQTRQRDTLVFELTDTRNSLERALMKFSHFKKHVERIDNTHYRVVLEYDKDDETDLLIQIMSFGSVVKVMEPEAIQQELANRIKKQLSMMEW